LDRWVDRFNRVERVAVIVPAFNEASTVRYVVRRTQKSFPDVIVVDDHSTDNTAEVVAKSGVTLVENSNEKGVGQAVLQGVRASRKPILITMDADGQHRPEDIPRLLGPILEGKADFVIGRRSRLPPSEAPVRRAVQSIIGRDLDVGSGSRAFRRDFLKGMKPTDVGFCGCGSLILFAASQGARFAEVPIHTFPRRHGRSKFSRVPKTSMHEDQAKFLRKRYSRAV
jgi:polyprenyl-phospho-N-acetylgalactosaminyl synthase